ncbi:hypothetical protein FNV43_RR20100 [Rhamnella rubrinervis]|uniref:Uncharacterized protein n=1 Tax=Rhamnella rubrinervis TaxID=2594499 RepID=A0A8K0E5T0_9ROSA|nr:hypothetical protein FNV43_RR20100 [Rhamnella rubrinervis]
MLRQGLEDVLLSSILGNKDATEVAHLHELDASFSDYYITCVLMSSYALSPIESHSLKICRAIFRITNSINPPPPGLCNFEFQPEKEKALKRNLSAEDGETEACGGLPQERRACGVYAQEMGGRGGTTSHSGHRELGDDSL